MVYPTTVFPFIEKNTTMSLDGLKCLSASCRCIKPNTKWTSRLKTDPAQAFEHATTVMLTSVLETLPNSTACNSQATEILRQ